MWLEASRKNFANVHGREIVIRMILSELEETSIRARANFCVIRHITFSLCYSSSLFV
jgi:hypothetical protein